MDLVVILAGTLLAGVGSVWLAAGLLRLHLRLGGAGTAQQLLSLAAGALLATAFMHLLPEALAAGVSPQLLCGVLLAGLVFFFLLDKAELWHHGHEHHDGEAAAGLAEQLAHGHAGHDHHHPHEHGGGHRHGAAAKRQGGGWAVLTGDSVHCFGDGILIASAFLADLQLGLVATLAVLVHEVPHHMGDLVVLDQTSRNRRAALVKVSLAGATTALGGAVGWWLVSRLEAYLPFFLVIASSSFIYVALADLIPQLQTRVSPRQTAWQIAGLAIGIGLVGGVGLATHFWGHDHPQHPHAASHGHQHAPADPAGAGTAAPPLSPTPVSGRH